MVIERTEHFKPDICIWCVMIFMLDAGRSTIHVRCLLFFWCTTASHITRKFLNCFMFELLVGVSYVFYNESCKLFFYVLPLLQLRHSISAGSLLTSLGVRFGGSSSDVLSVPKVSPFQLRDRLIVKVYLQTPESHSANHYKSILVSNHVCCLCETELFWQH